MEVEEFAKMVGGRIVPENETGADRKNFPRVEVPKFKSESERRLFYMDYIPALYFVEIEEMDPDKLTKDDFEFFWMCFVTGLKELQKEESDMDG